MGGKEGTWEASRRGKLGMRAVGIEINAWAERKELEAYAGEANLISKGWGAHGRAGRGVGDVWEV